MENSNVLKKRFFNESVFIAIGYVALFVTIISVIVILFLGNVRRDYMLDNYEKSVSLTTYGGYKGLLNLSEVKDFLPKDFETVTVTLEGIDFIETGVFNENSTFNLIQIKDDYYIVNLSVYEQNKLFRDILVFIMALGMTIMTMWYIIYIYYSAGE